MDKLLFSLALIFLGLSLGYFLKGLIHRGTRTTRYSVESIRKALQRIAVLVLSPISVLGSLWVVNLESIKLIALPFVGIFTLLLGGFLAFCYSKQVKMPRNQAGAFIVAGGFTNIGLIGGLVCYLFLGESGYALVSIYGLFELFSYYAFGFPVAKSFSSEIGNNKSFLVRLRKVILDPFVIVALGSIVLGFFLNLSGIPRPEFYGRIIELFIPLSTLLLLTSIGMSISFREIGKFIKEGVVIAVIKFLIVPIVATSLAYLIGFGGINDGLPLKVVLILSCMPVGFTAMIPPTIYDLDIDLTNTCWLVTTISLIFVIPVLHYLIKSF